MGVTDADDDDDDNDGLLDVEDDDDDGDGIADEDEDHDGDGVSNDEDEDDDGDGVLDEMKMTMRMGWRMTKIRMMTVTVSLMRTTSCKNSNVPRTRLNIGLDNTYH